MEEEEKKHILFAHDAWWFLYYHPAFRLNFRSVKDNLDSVRGEDRDLYKKVSLDNRTSLWVYEHKHTFHYALVSNLDIHYTHTNSKGCVSDNKSENVYTECWLEFGPLQYYSDYTNECNASRAKSHEYDSYYKEPLEKWMFDHINNSHDWQLDCGAPTFDEALVKLANNVLEHYGDYVSDNEGHDICGGKEVCKDCLSVDVMMKRMRLRNGID